MNTYRYTFVAACPANGEQIVYSLSLQHQNKVLVEHIKTACALHREGYQEYIAADLHARFGGTLTLRAMHHGVEIETVLAQRATQPAAQGVDVVQAAKALCKHAAKVQNVNFDDYWLIHAEEFKEEAQIVLDAAQAKQGGA